LCPDLMVIRHASNDWKLEKKQILVGMSSAEELDETLLQHTGKNCVGYIVSARSCEPQESEASRLGATFDLRTPHDCRCIATRHLISGEIFRSFVSFRSNRWQNSRPIKFGTCRVARN
jgi:hypothetical protein